MSLINQMLQDLEQRSAGNLAGNSMHQQVRAVPDRSGLHPAWWLVLVLTLLLSGVILWFWLRPVPQVMPAPILALKIAPDLSALPSPAAQSPLPAEQPSPVTSGPVGLAAAPVAPIAATSPESPPTIDAAANQPRKAENFREPDGAVAPKTPMPLAKIATQSVAPAPDSVKDEQAKPAKLTKQVKELTPQQLAENNYRLASTALQSGHNADAIADLEQALMLDPQHAAARQMLVGILLQSKRTDEAVRLARDGLALDPSLFGLAMILARIQVDQADLKSALATLDHSLPYAQDRADYQAFFAALLQRNKQNKEAIVHYIAALEKTPQNGVWWMGLGISLQAENRLPEAKEAFGRAKTSNTLTPDLLAFVDQKLAQLR
jgi:MSHA biogenesis protein MshN